MTPEAKRRAEAVRKLLERPAARPVVDRLSPEENKLLAAVLEMAFEEGVGDAIKRLREKLCR